MSAEYILPRGHSLIFLHHGHTPDGALSLQMENLSTTFDALCWCEWPFRSDARLTFYKLWVRLWDLIVYCVPSFLKRIDVRETIRESAVVFLRQDPGRGAIPRSLNCQPPLSVNVASHDASKEIRDIMSGTSGVAPGTGGARKGL